MWPVEQRAFDAYRQQFGREPQMVASAPGRVNLIGEHTDYTGGFVLPCAIDRRIAVALGISPTESRHHGRVYAADLADMREMVPTGGQRDGSWADYLRGVAWALTRAGMVVPAVEAAIAGEVPQGAGLSSSAALEAATALALTTLAQQSLPRRELALLCQQAENGFVGVQCGIMDQYAALLCTEGHALFIDCASLEAETVPLALEASGLALVVCDTRVKRGLGATAYNERRASCERAAKALGVPTLRQAQEDDLARLTGEDLKRARHVVRENARVQQAVSALRANDFAALGRLMYASHESLREDYAVSTPELDAIVTCAQEVGALGARLTGAGFGGCALALLARAQVEQLTETITQHFAQQGFTAPSFYLVRPSEGAALAA
ncbi:MAG TPA: galactokinase [Ktedonobacterales bacterium]|nr:galactokinase [Ktedonobacterales bacterium]